MEKKNFSLYDAIYHVASIVHKKETISNRDLYYSVNRDLTYRLAIKAKNEGVKSFVFLSTMAVYGLVGEIGKNTIISKETITEPTSHYGKSKLEAEKLLRTLQSKKFCISILRIPMIYGNNCPGNYNSLSKLARKTPFFPKINNKRSMIYVDHLSDIVAHVIEKKLFGIFLVKNPEDVNTVDTVNLIGSLYDKKIYNSPFLGLLLLIIGNNFIVLRKMFGNIIFKDDDCKIEGFEFKKISYEESITLAEGKELSDKY